MQKIKFKVENMHCAGCAATIEKTFQNEKGIEKISVNLPLLEVDIVFDNKVISLKKIENLFKTIGFDAVIANDEKKEESSSKDNKNIKLYLELFISVFLLAFILYFEISLHTKSPLPFSLGNPEKIYIIAIIELFMVLPIIYINREYFISGFKALFKGRANMDSLFTTSATMSFIYGLVITCLLGINRGNSGLVMKYSENIYFKAAAMILTFVSIGKTIEKKATIKTASAITELVQIKPNVATLVLNDNSQKVVSVDDLKIGDTIIVKPGETIPIDCKIIQGETYLDESRATGESIPVKKGVNDNCLQGTTNQTNTLYLKVTKLNENSLISQIIKIVKETTSQKAAIAMVADKIAAVFVPAIFAIAILGFIIWISITRDFTIALRVFASTIVVSCPCTLGLATPLGITAGIGRAAKENILFKKVESLEELGKITDIVLDKTGTITEGKPSVITLKVKENIQKDIVITIAKSIEMLSEHVFAKAIINYANQNNVVDTYKVENFKADFGMGVQGQIAGKTYYIGSENYIKSNKIELNNIKEYLDSVAKENITPILVASEEQVLGIFSVFDRVRADSIEAIAKLKEKYVVTMLTGDKKETALSVAKQAGIDNVVYEMLPSEKKDIIQKMQKENKKVCYIGDGINDAAALAVADVSMAIGNGVDIALNSADIILSKSSLLDSVKAFKLSKYTMHIIKTNLLWGFIYNFVSIPIALGALYPNFSLTPGISALMMGCSSVLVALNSLRINLFELNKEVLNEVTINLEGVRCDNCKKALKNIVESKLQGNNFYLSDDRTTLKFVCKKNKEQIKNVIQNGRFVVKGISLKKKSTNKLD